MRGPEEGAATTRAESPELKVCPADNNTRLYRHTRTVFPGLGPAETCQRRTGFYCDVIQI